MVKKSKTLTRGKSKRLTRHQLLEILTREKYLTASDFTPGQFLTASDFQNHQRRDKLTRQKVTPGKITRDYFKNIDVTKKARVNNTNLTARQNINAVKYNKKLTASEKLDGVRFYNNQRREILNIDGVKLQLDGVKYIDGVNITALYFKNNATRDNYIINNLTASEKRKLTRQIGQIKYKQRQKVKKSKLLDKICQTI